MLARSFRNANQIEVERPCHSPDLTDSVLDWDQTNTGRIRRVGLWHYHLGAAGFAVTADQSPDPDHRKALATMVRKIPKALKTGVQHINAKGH